MGRVLVVAFGGALCAMSGYSVALPVATFWNRDSLLETFSFNVSDVEVAADVHGVGLQQTLPFVARHHGPIPLRSTQIEPATS